MPIRELSVTSDCSVLATRLQARHKKQLAAVNIIAIEKMIRLIQEVIKGHNKSAALEIIREEYEINPDEDLNRLNDKDLKRRKAIMDLNFKKNNIDQDHPDFVYDKEVEFKGEKRMSGWDSDSDQDETESTPRPVLVEDENDLLYPVQKSPAPPLGAESIPSEEQVSPMGEVTPKEDNARIEISPSNDKAFEEPYSSSLNKDSNQTELLSNLTKSASSLQTTSNQLNPSFIQSGNLTGKPDTLTSIPGIPASKPKPLLEPIALPGLSRQAGSVSFNKALPPLDLNRSKLAPILPLSNKSLEPIEHLNLEDSIKSDDVHNDDKSDDDSFSDDSELLPAVDVHKTSPAKKLFGLDSDEVIQENPPKENKHFGGDLTKSADQQKNGGKIEEKSPRSISVGDNDTNDEEDFW